MSGSGLPSTIYVEDSFDTESASCRSFAVLNCSSHTTPIRSVSSARTGSQGLYGFGDPPAFQPLVCAGFSQTAQVLSATLLLTRNDSVSRVTFTAPYHFPSTPRCNSATRVISAATFTSLT